MSFPNSPGILQLQICLKHGSASSIVTKYFRQWLDLPISATLSAIILSHKYLGLSLQLRPVKFQQCQTVLRSSLKSSQGDAIINLWKSTNCETSIQYDTVRLPRVAEVDFQGQL